MPLLRSRPFPAGLLFVLALAGATSAQEPATGRPPTPPAFRVDTGVVMLDVVVRDKKGRLIRDLRADEVQVFEDGVIQEVTGFRFVETGRETVPAAAGAPAPAPKPEAKQVTLVTLLFDQLGAEARPIARKAALDFLAADHRADLAQIEQRMLDLTDRLERQLQGESSIFALIALANQQQKRAGRKTILYFSEGLQVTSRLEPVFRSAVSEANRANVSIYAVDARGLGTQNQLLGTQGQERLRRAVAAVWRQQMSRGGVAVTAEEAQAGETVEESLRVNTQGTLGDLAESTGGFLIANTNDMKAGMERVAGDIVGYYEVVYAPARVETDGRFRELRVKVAREGASVQVRKGYFAVPAGEGIVTFPYEMVLLKALRADPLPRDFDFRSSAFRYARVSEGQQYTLVMEVPLRSFSFKKEGGSYKAHFSFLAALRHPTQGIVQKFSQDSPVVVPAERKDALLRGNAIFTRSFTVPPGRYTLETVAQDEDTKKTSVHKASLVVGKAAPALGLSSLAIIKRTEPVPAGSLESDDALRIGPTRIVPELGEPTLGPGDGLPLFLIAYPAAGASEKPELTLALLLDGAVVARSTPELPAPDEKGRIAYVATVPSTGLAGGRYEVRATLRQGGATTEETTFFSIGAPAAASAQAPPGKGR